MNIFRPQKPYVFRPPLYSRVWTPFLVQVSHRIMLARQFKTRVTHIAGLEQVAALSKERHAVLIAPNHADHADPHVLVNAAHRASVLFHFMAAREAFERGRIGAFALQRMGAFSVDREGADVAAIKMAMRILQEGEFITITRSWMNSTKVLRRFCCARVQNCPKASARMSCRPPCVTGMTPVSRPRLGTGFPASKNVLPGSPDHIWTSLNVSITWEAASSR